MNNYKIVKNEDWKEVEVNGEILSIPCDWSVVYINDFFAIVAGQSPDSSSTLGDVGLPFHQGNTFFTSKFIGESTKKIALVNSKKEAKENSLLISVRAPVGQVNITKENISIGRGLAALTPFDSSIDYGFYLLKFNQNKITALGSGSTFEGMKVSEFKMFQICIPPLEQQSAIATILSKQEQVISNLEELIKKLELRFQYMSDELLSGRIRAKEENGKTILYKNTEWKEVEVNGEITEIPSDWAVGKIKDSIKLNMGNTPKKEGQNYMGDLSWITISNLTEKYIKTHTAKITRNKNIRIFPAGSLVGSFKMSVGRFGFLTEDSAINEAIICIKRDGTKNYLDYLYYSLPEIFTKNAEQNGQGLLLLNQEKINNLNYITCNFQEQKLISYLLKNQDNLIFKYKNIMEKEQKKIRLLFDKLLTGQYVIKEKNANK